MVSHSICAGVTGRLYSPLGGAQVAGILYQVKSSIRSEGMA